MKRMVWMVGQKPSQSILWNVNYGHNLVRKRNFTRQFYCVKNRKWLKDNEAKPQSTGQCGMASGALKNIAEMNEFDRAIN